MAVLSDAERLIISAKFMSDASALRDPLPAMTKADLRAAIDAVDAWVDANASAYNLAIPQPARANLTARQKAALLEYVVKRRFEVS